MMVSFGLPFKSSTMSMFISLCKCGFLLPVFFSQFSSYYVEVLCQTFYKEDSGVDRPYVIEFNLKGYFYKRVGLGKEWHVDKCSRKGPRSCDKKSHNHSTKGLLLGDLHGAHPNGRYQLAESFTLKGQLFRPWTPFLPVQFM